MKLLIKNGRVLHPVTSAVLLQDMLVDDGKISLLERGIDAQADQVIDCIEESRDFFKEYKGNSLSEYDHHEREFAIEMVDRICEILGLNAVYTHSDDPEHHDDVVLEIYNDAGQKIAEMDPDAVKKTNVPETAAAPVNYTYVVLAAVLLLGAVAAALVSKKFAAER